LSKRGKSRGRQGIKGRDSRKKKESGEAQKGDAKAEELLQRISDSAERGRTGGQPTSGRGKMGSLTSS